MAGSLRLLLLGLAIGVLSAFYPQIPAYLPASVSRFVPFLGSVNDLNHPEAQSWTKYAQYQANSPPADNHDPYGTYEADEPKLRRVANPKAKEAEEREKEKALKELEERAQAAGKENHVGPELPVYFLEQAQPTLWETMLDEIRKEVKLEHVVTIEASPILNEAAIVLAGDEGVTSHLVELLSEARFPTSISNDTRSSFHAVFAPLTTATLSLPDISSWSSETWYLLGETLHPMRHEGTVFVALGSARPFTSQEPPSSFMRTLRQIMRDYTAHPREKSLAALVSGAAGKPTKGVKSHLTPLYVAVGVADQSEGEQTRGGWRFGHTLQ